jgi:hypothetical protein
MVLAWHLWFRYERVSFTHGVEVFAVTTAAVPAEWRVERGQLVPLSDLARSVREYGVSYDAVSAAARRGLLDVAYTGGPGVRGPARRITVESALFALAIAALCQLLKVAFQTLLRAARESGAQLTSAGLTIPLKAA